MSLPDAALDIQMRRRWSTARCCELAGIARATWFCVVTRGTSRPTPRIRARLQAFVDDYGGNAVAPERRRWKRGPDHHLSKRTPEMIARILASNAKGVELAKEFGVSSALITRVRQEAREAS